MFDKALRIEIERKKQSQYKSFEMKIGKQIK